MSGQCSSSHQSENQPGWAGNRSSEWYPGDRLTAVGTRARMAARPIRSASDIRTQLGEFLTHPPSPDHPGRRGLPVFDTGRRRVPGLRREEVAMLAGMRASTTSASNAADFTGISESVLQGIVHALHLDEAERATSSTAPRPQQHSHSVGANPSNTSPARPPANPGRHRRTTPAFILNGRLDVLAVQHLGRALNAADVRRVTDPPNNQPGSCSSTAPPASSGATGTRSPTNRRHAAHRSRPRPLRP